MLLKNQITCLVIGSAEIVIRYDLFNLEHFSKNAPVVTHETVKFAYYFLDA